MTLTQRDLDEIESVVDEKIDEQTRLLPTKDEFFGKMDEVMGELKAIRENQDVVNNKVYEDHENRLSKIEKKLQIQPAI